MNEWMNETKYQRLTFAVSKCRAYHMSEPSASRKKTQINTALYGWEIKLIFCLTLQENGRYKLQ